MLQPILGQLSTDFWLLTSFGLLIDLEWRNFREALPKNRRKVNDTTVVIFTA